MKVKDLIKFSFSVYRCSGYSDRHDKVVSLRDWLGQYAVRYEYKIDCAREWNRSNHDFYQKVYKPFYVPAAAFGGIWPTLRREDAKDKHLNGLMVMDIDKYDGDLEKLKMKFLKEFDSAFLASKSLSGKGIFVVFYYDTYYDYKSVWCALEQDIKDKLGVTVDPSCKDCSRLRVLSYDKVLMKSMETDIIPYNKILIKKDNIEDVNIDDMINRTMTKESYKELVICIEQLVKNGYGKHGFSYYDPDKYEDDNQYDYARWRRDAWRLGSLERSDIGRRLFRFISEHAEGYDGVNSVDIMFDKYIHRCPEYNNVGYYFALRERMRH